MITAVGLIGCFMLTCYLAVVLVDFAEKRSVLNVKNGRSMNRCSICGGPNDPARVAIGRDHCIRQSCIDTWRQRRIADADLALVTVHKQGQMWVKRSEVPGNSMRRDGGR